MISSLPAEILLQVGELLDDQKSINNLSRTCGRLYSILNRHLYIHNARRNDGSCLAWAARKGQARSAQMAIDVRAHGSEWRIVAGKALGYAAQYGHLELIKILLSTNEVDINTNDLNDEEAGTALSIACGFGWHDIVEYLLAIENIDVNMGDSEDKSPLCYAACGGNLSIAKRLLRTPNIKPSATGRKGETALLLAAERGNESMVQLLLEWIHPGIRDEQGRSPLFVAMVNRHESTSRLLIASGKIDKMAGSGYLVAVGRGGTAGHTALTMATDLGMESVVRQLLTLPFDNSRCETATGQSALAWAIVKGDSHMFKILSDSGRFSLKVTDCHGLDVLSRACIVGNLEAAMLLISRGGCINSKNREGRTPISLAAEHGQDALIKELLRCFQNADIESRDNEGRTPLTWAVLMGRVNVIQTLVSLGYVDVNSRDNDGRTPILHAVKMGDPGAVRVLLSSRVIDVDARDSKNRTPLMLACMARHTHIVELLLDHGDADPEARDDMGQTPLMYATGASDPDVKSCWFRMKVVKLLLGPEQAQVGSRDSLGWTALMWASFTDNVMIVELLLDVFWDDVNTRDYKGQSPLHVAAKTGLRRLSLLLINRGAVINLEDKDGHTPFTRACENGYSSIVELFLALGSNAVSPKTARSQNPLLHAAAHGQAEIVSFLIQDQVFDVNTKDKKGRTALALAAANEHFSVAHVLIKTAGVAVDAPDADGRTPLMTAVFTGGYLEMINEYMASENGWESEYLDEDLYYDSAMIVDELLSSSRANVNAKDKEGKTALSIASWVGHGKIVEMLLAVDDIDVWSRDMHGNTAKSLALASGYEAVAALFP